VTAAADLRARAEGLSAHLPPLLAAADHLAATVLLGDHGRRRAGMGDEFWQYRPAHAGDGARLVDWRRSARGDAHFVREHEWQAAQSVLLWVDDARSMQYASRGLEEKAARARLLALALTVLLVRGGERVGLTGPLAPPRSGQAQVARIAAALAVSGAQDYGTPDARGITPHSRAVFISDFLGDISAVEGALTSAADRGVKGALVQVLDPSEEAFPFDGRTIFESMSGAIRFETLKAGDLRDRYRDRLAERKDRLALLAERTGWLYLCHHVDTPAQSALLWLYQALERRN
jgi:uncharacterized protein (DUF58 family)